MPPTEEDRRGAARGGDASGVVSVLPESTDMGTHGALIYVIFPLNSIFEKYLFCEISRVHFSAIFCKQPHWRTANLEIGDDL